VQRPSGRKSVYLLQMKPSALKRETLKFYRDRWKNEGVRAVSGADGAHFFDFNELAEFIKNDKLGPVTPAERLELYERLVRKLFHAHSIGYSALSEGELGQSDAPVGVLGEEELEAQLEEQLQQQQQFTPPSFILYPRTQPTKPDVSEDKLRIRHERKAAKRAGAYVELIECAFPRHLPEMNHWLEDKIRKTHELSHHDLTLVRNHFGEELALYTAFMNKYSQTLFPFALLGVGMYVLCMMLPGAMTYNYTYLAPFYVVAMVVFSALLQQKWKHENQKLAYLWGVTEYEPADYVRPEFRGERVYNPVKEKYEYEYPVWKRALKKKPLSYFVISLMVLLLLVISFALYVQLQDSLENPNPAYDYAVLGLVPVRMLLGTGLNATVYGIVVMVGLLTAFQKVARWLCTMENYRTDKEFDDQWVLKMFFFIYIDGYCLFWILGLYHIPFAMYSSFEELQQVEVAGVRLFYKEDQLDVYLDQITAISFTALIVVQTLTYFLENVLPFILKSQADKANAKERIDQSPRARFLLELCDEADRGGFGLFDDWYDLTLFLSYGTVYSLLWPLAPIVNYVNNVVETRTDLTKVIEISRRPVPRKVNNIGMWEKCMGFQCYANVVQIALVAAFSSRRFDYYLEHVGLTDDFYFETHGDETHVRREVKLVISAIVTAGGFVILYMVAAIVGAQDPATRTKLARDDYRERQHNSKLSRNVGDSIYRGIAGIGGGAARALHLV